MGKRTPVAVFLAASTIIAAGSIASCSNGGGDQPSQSQQTNTAEVAEADGLGGLKEWTTDQDLEEESSLDEAAAAAAEKAKEEDICIPIGEGENCW